MLEVLFLRFGAGLGFLGVRYLDFVWSTRYSGEKGGVGIDA